MDVVVINDSNADIFKNLLVKSVYDMIKSGIPVIALGGVEYDMAVAAIAGQVEYGDFDIKSFFVAPSYRNCGIGSLLLSELEFFLEGKVLKVTANFAEMDSETSLLSRFLERRFFGRRWEDNPYYKATLGEILDSINGIDMTKSEKIKSIKECRGISLRVWSKELRSNDAPVPDGGLTGDGIEKDISMLRLEKDRVNAFVIFDRSVGGVITQSEVWNGSGKPAALMSLISAAALAGKKKYGGDEPVFFQPVNDNSEALLHYLIPSAKPVSFIYQKTLF
ncbi:MAG: GNAT family N-acetyltransferase [Lachnospiraceae bacterium]|nr:GNAT family N-acetyltransferase [Lachnospiraceae bacterium]